MGFLKKVFGAKEVVVDPADLTIPDVIATNKPGVQFRKAAGTQQVKIEIVGESFRVKNVAAVALAAAGKSFDIYLIAEPENPHDKKAVAVYAANLHIGYIAKPDNKQWFKWVAEARERSEILWGNARAVSRTGTSNTGIFGHIYMPKVGQDSETIRPLKMTDAALKKAVEKAVALSNSTQYPDTVAQLKSSIKKAAAVATSLAAHAKWVEENQESQNTEAWESISDACEEIFSASLSVPYASDPDEFDVVSLLDDLVEALESLSD